MDLGQSTMILPRIKMNIERVGMILYGVKMITTRAIIITAPRIMTATRSIIVEGQCKTIEELREIVKGNGNVPAKEMICALIASNWSECFPLAPNYRFEKTP